MSQRGILLLLLLTVSLSTTPCPVLARAGGGCFLAGTTVTLEDGAVKPIDALSVGDRVLALGPDETLVPTRVERLFVHKVERFLELELEHTTLRVTPEHPFYTGHGQFVPAEHLEPGVQLYRHTPRGLMRVEVEAVTTIDSESIEVFNIRVGSPHTFFAEGIAVHNKGGYSSSSSSSSGYSSSSSSSSGYSNSSSFDDDNSSSSGDANPFIMIFAVIVGGIWGIGVFFRDGYRKMTSTWGDEDEASWTFNKPVEFSFSKDRVDARDEHTRAVMSQLTHHDPLFDPDVLAGQIREVFLKVQDAWSKRDYREVRDLLMPDIYREHIALLEGLKRNHEINFLEDLAVENVHFVHLRFTQNQDWREITALITARGRDVYLDDRTRERLRGDSAHLPPPRFQELWVFQRSENGFRLREIEQTSASDRMSKTLHVDEGLDLEADDAPQALGPAAVPRLIERNSRIYRALYTLAQTDERWRPEHLEACTRRALLSYLQAREASDPDLISEDELHPDFVESFHTQLQSQAAQGYTYKYINLCIRNVELILFRKQTLEQDDDFIARVICHAQIHTYQHQQCIRMQPEIETFETYTTFHRHEGTWKLRELVEPARARELINALPAFDEAPDIFASTTRPTDPLAFLPSPMSEADRAAGFSFTVEGGKLTFHDAVLTLEADDTLEASSGHIELTRPFKAMLSTHREDGTQLLHLELRQQAPSGPGWSLLGLSAPAHELEVAPEGLPLLSQRFARVQSEEMLVLLAALQWAAIELHGSALWTVA